MSILVQPTGYRSNRALLFRPRAATSDCTNCWCGAICPSNPPTGEIQDFPSCSVIPPMGDPQTSREESLTLYVGPSRGRKVVSACVKFRRRAAPLRARAGGLRMRVTSRDGAERSPCLRWSPVAGATFLGESVAAAQLRASGCVANPGVSLQTCSFILGEACVAVASQKLSGGSITDPSECANALFF